MTPEDKAPDMPLPCPLCGSNEVAFTTKQVKMFDDVEREMHNVVCYGCSCKIGFYLTKDIAAELWNKRYTRTIQSPDQGAGDLAKAIAIVQDHSFYTGSRAGWNKALGNDEQQEPNLEIIKPSTAEYVWALQILNGLQALTRPPLDLAGLKAEYTDAYELWDKSSVEFIEYMLDHLQAVRPEWFGGK